MSINQLFSNNGSVPLRPVTVQSFNNINSSIPPLASSSNIVFGAGAGASLTTGTNNVFLGVNAGSKCTTGIRNICMLDNSGGILSTGSYNIYMGEYTGFYSTTASDNIALGNQAGENIGTASKNIILGSQSGLTIGTSRNNIVIGHNSDVPTDTNYQINIGNIVKYDGAGNLTFGTTGNPYSVVNSIQCVSATGTNTLVTSSTQSGTISFISGTGVNWTFNYFAYKVGILKIIQIDMSVLQTIPNVPSTINSFYSVFSDTFDSTWLSAQNLVNIQLVNSGVYDVNTSTAYGFAITLSNIPPNPTLFSLFIYDLTTGLIVPFTAGSTDGFGLGNTNSATFSMSYV